MQQPVCVTFALMPQLLPMWVWIEFEFVYRPRMEKLQVISGVERCFLAFVSRQTDYFIYLFFFTAKSGTIVSHSSQAPNRFGWQFLHHAVITGEIMGQLE